MTESFFIQDINAAPANSSSQRAASIAASVALVFLDMTTTVYG